MTGGKTNVPKHIRDKKGEILTRDQTIKRWEDTEEYEGIEVNSTEPLAHLTKIQYS